MKNEEWVLLVVCEVVCLDCGELNEELGLFV